ncbi:uncharacterized protein LOC132548128 [Ylistrum balloti]|uniref:uncharacterized protein LOC132548128 n=1 Tax=Ylistrum balloti TaxID=509963 RepID=UPI002905DD40|nr:uncharacterized protein LOC132548128 [Ylistrum balloti]
MNNFLAVCVLMVFGVNLCDGQCRTFNSAPQLDGATPPLGCYWKDEFIGVMSHLTKNCETCYCSEGGVLSCCVNAMHIVQVPDDCKIVPAEDGCGDRAVKLDNENEDCMHGVAAVSRRDLQ